MTSDNKFLGALWDIGLMAVFVVLIFIPWLIRSIIDDHKHD